MAKGPTITTIASGYYSRTALNDNFTNIDTAFDNTLSLDGSTPNAMGADFDLNNNDLINVDNINAGTLRLGGTAIVPTSSLSTTNTEYKYIFKNVSDLLVDTRELTTYYTVGDYIVAGGFRYEVVSSGGDVVNAAGVQFDALPTNNVFNVYQFGADTASANNSAIIEGAMLKAADTGVPLHMGNDGDTFTCTATISPVLAGKHLELLGTPTLNFTGAAYLILTGTITEVTYVSVAVGKATNSITVNSATGLTVGDMIAIEDDTDFSFSPTQQVSREAYHAGDFNEITAIAGAVVTLRYPLRDGYAGVTTDKVFVVSPATVKTSAFNVVSTNTALYAVQFALCRNSVFSVNSEGGSSGACSIARSWQCVGQGGNHVHLEPASGTNYGLTIANCQDLTINDFHNYGTRHGTTLGGAGVDGSVACRNVWIVGGSSQNTTSTLHAADMHGNTDLCGYIRHTTNNHFGIGGRDPAIIDCVAYVNGNQKPVSWNEIMGGNRLVRNMTVHKGAGATYTSIVGFSASSYADIIAEDYSEEIDGITVADGTGLVSITNFTHAAASPVRASSSVDNIKISGVVASNFRLRSDIISNPSAHGAVLAPDLLHVGDHCVWNALTTHYYGTFAQLNGQSFAGTTLRMPSQTKQTTNTILNGAYRGTVATISFINYPITPKATVTASGLSSGASQMGFGTIDSKTANSVTFNVTTGNSLEIVGADRVFDVDVEMSANGLIV